MEKERKIIPIKRYEFIPDKNGGHFKEHLEEIDITDTADRHKLLCQACGHSGYPECTKTCNAGHDYPWGRE